jgi:pyridoxal 5'-phosphate synthase pdxT subunit
VRSDAWLSCGGGSETRPYVFQLQVSAGDNFTSIEMKNDGLKIGIVAIQGDYEAHAKALQRLGVEYRFVRTPADLHGLAGVILPGGESTTHLKVMTEEGLFDALKKFAAADGAFFGTCAGTILLAKEVHGPAQASLGLLDAAVLRNGYGRQLASDVHMGQTKLRAAPLEMVFIRAPIIERVGAGVEILAEDAGHPVLVREGKILAATFHPELSDDTAVHEFFVRMARDGVAVAR